MLRDEAVGRIQNLLGYTTARTTEIEGYLRNVQEQLENDIELPWFLLSDPATPWQGSTTIGSRGVALPTDFIRQFSEDGLYYLNSGSQEFLANSELNYLNKLFKNATGSPEGYYLGVSSFVLYPIPDKIYTLEINSYYKKDVVLSSNITNNWLTYAPELLIGAAGILAAEATRDKEALNSFVNLRSLGLATLFKISTAREESGRSWIIGGED